MKQLGERNITLLVQGLKTTGTFVEACQYIEEELYIKEAMTIQKFCEWADREIGGGSASNMEILFQAFICPEDQDKVNAAHEIRDKIKDLHALFSPNKKEIVINVQDTPRENMNIVKKVVEKTKKTYFNISIRLRQDNGTSKPEYTQEELMSKLTDGSARFEKSENGTVFILDNQRTNKIMGVVESIPSDNNCKCYNRDDEDYDEETGNWICTDCNLVIKMENEKELLKKASDYTDKIPHDIEESDLVEQFGTDWGEARRIMKILTSNY